MSWDICENSGLPQDKCECLTELMKTNEIVRIVLFCALLFLVVIEFIIGVQVSTNVNNPEQWRQLMGVLNTVGILDKIATVLLLGALAFIEVDSQD